MKIAAHYDHSPVTGYGRMSAEIVAAIKRAGVEVVDAPDPSVENILFMTPPHRPDGWYKGQKSTIVTMWETTELAFEHNAGVPSYDTVLVPSQANYELFKEVNPNTHFVPLGCDYERWKPIKRERSDPFTVITAGQGGRRKGIDISIRVFKQFRDIIKAEGFPAPRLWIKSVVHLENPDPGIVVLDSPMSIEDEIDFYAKGHVYLGLSRGEGWGMIPHQTIAQGMPTILSNAHGHAAFARFGLGVDCGWMEAENGVWGRNGNWWSPNEDQALAHLLDVFHNYNQHAEAAMLNAEGIRKEFTWDRTAEQILSHIISSPDFKAGEWYECPQRYLNLRVNRPCEASIGGVYHHFVPDKDYDVTADVKRVMYDAGYVDESCLDPAEKGFLERTSAGKMFIDKDLLGYTR